MCLLCFVFSSRQANGISLQFASARLRGDPSTCLIAAHQNGMSLKFAQPVRSPGWRACACAHVCVHVVCVCLCLCLCVCVCACVRAWVRVCANQQRRLCDVARCVVCLVGASVQGKGHARTHARMVACRDDACRMSRRTTKWSLQLFGRMALLCSACSPGCASRARTH